MPGLSGWRLQPNMILRTSSERMGDNVETKQKFISERERMALDRAFDISERSESVFRIFREWRDWKADYCYLLKEWQPAEHILWFTLPGKWKLITKATFNRGKAERWAKHYNIPLPEDTMNLQH